MVANSILLITGANRGLGLETVKALCKSKQTYTILLGGRSLKDANAAVLEVSREFPDSTSVLKPMQVDIEDDESISKAFEDISKEYDHVDILINNAGSLFDFQVYSGKMKMREMWNKTWAVNTTGTQVLTHTFVPLLLKSSDPRLLFVTSGTSTLAGSEDTSIFMNRSPEKGWPKKESGYPAYRSSKCGMNMMMREWTRNLKNDGVKIWAISPGYLATGLGGNVQKNKDNGALDPSLGANFIRDVVEGSRDEETGKVVGREAIQSW